MGQEKIQLKPSLRSADMRRPDQLFDICSLRIPQQLAISRIKYDRYTCATCGFASLKYQQTWKVGKSSRTFSDLRTACSPCWNVMNLETALSARAGILIWLPELSQTRLNQVILELFAARISSGDIGKLATEIFVKLNNRSSGVAENCDFDDLSVLVQKLRKAEDDKEDKSPLLSNFDRGLRLLPLDRLIFRSKDLEYNKFPQMLAYWRSKNGPLAKSSFRFAITAQELLLQLDEKSNLCEI